MMNDPLNYKIAIIHHWPRKSNKYQTLSTDPEGPRGLRFFNPLNFLPWNDFIIRHHFSVVIGDCMQKIILMIHRYPRIRKLFDHYYYIVCRDTLGTVRRNILDAISA